MQEYNISPFSIFAAVACTLPPLLHPPTDDLIPCRVDVRKDIGTRSAERKAPHIQTQSSKQAKKLGCTRKA
eukprot:1147157-Pelagomonas_calceolata.AAC.4